MLEDYIQIVTNPKEFFRDNTPSFNKSAIFATLMIGLASIIEIIFGLIAGRDLLLEDALTGFLAGGLLLIVYPIVSIIFGLLLMTIMSGLTHLFVKLLGGSDFKKTFSVFSHALILTPVSALASLLPISYLGSFLALVVYLYYLFILVEGVKVVHKFSTVKAALAVGLSYLVIILAAAAFLLMLILGFAAMVSTA